VQGKSRRKKKLVRFSNSLSEKKPGIGEINRGENDRKRKVVRNDDTTIKEFSAHSNRRTGCHGRRETWKKKAAEWALERAQRKNEVRTYGTSILRISKVIAIVPGGKQQETGEVFAAQLRVFQKT